jgi:hypothetical protein
VDALTKRMFALTKNMGHEETLNNGGAKQAH